MMYNIEMKKLTGLFLLCLILAGCTSTKLISHDAIPDEKNTIYLAFDDYQATNVGGFMMGYVFIPYTETGSFNTLTNRMKAKEILCAKGYSITTKVENADLILYAGCESDLVTEVTILIVDAITEKEYVITKGTYGMGWDLNDDIENALINALESIPER